MSNVYTRHGMFVEAHYMDREFEKLRGMVPGKSTLNMTAESEHVIEIEMQIRVINKHVQ